MLFAFINFIAIESVTLSYENNILDLLLKAVPWCSNDQILYLFFVKKLNYEK